MNINLFKYYAAENGDMMRDVAKAIGVVPATLSAKLHRAGGDFSRNDIAILRKRWHLTAEQCAEIFFD